MSDTYNIKFTSDGQPSGKTALTVGPTDLNTSTSLKIHGKYSAPFGEDLWTNMVHLLENFCSATGPDPDKVTMGQLWFDSSTQTLKVWKILSVSPYTIGWSPVSAFSSPISASLSTLLANNGITGSTSDFDNYFTTKGYTDLHYIPSGSFVSGTDVTSKYKIKYSTNVTFNDPSDINALVTKDYVDTKVGTVGLLSINVLPDGKMVTTKSLLGQADNAIPTGVAGNSTDYNNYYVTRGYTDQRYLQIGTFDNTIRRQTVSKIKYSPDISYATNADDDYTLVHKKYVTDYVTTVVNNSAVPSWLNTTMPSTLSVLYADGINPIQGLAVGTSNQGKVLAINNSSTGFEWVPLAAPTNLPSWVSTLPSGVMVSNGTLVNGIATTDSGKILSSGKPGSAVAYEWNSAADLGLLKASDFTANNAKGFLYSDGTAVVRQMGGNETVLTINSTGIPEWIAKSSLGGGGGSPGWTGTQQWRDESTNRKTNTDYTNNTGYPIMISIDDGNIANNGLQLYCNNLLIVQSAISAGNCTANVTDIIPAGATYRVMLFNNSTSKVNVRWRELTLQYGSSANNVSFTPPAKGVVTSDGTVLSSTGSFGTNGYLLGSDNGTGLKWIDPSTISGGGGGTLVNSNAIAAYDPSAITLPKTVSTSTTLFDGSAKGNTGWHYSTPLNVLKLTLPTVTTDTKVAITVGCILKSVATSSVSLTSNAVYCDINGSNIRGISGSETFMFVMKAGDKYDINLTAQYTTYLGNITDATVTVSERFIEVLAVGGTLTGTGSGSSSSSGAVKMVTNSVPSVSATSSLTSLVTISLPANSSTTAVDYWVTIGVGNISGGALVWQVLKGSSIVTNGSASENLMTHIKVTIPANTTTITPLTMKGQSTNATYSAACNNCYMSAVPMEAL